MSDEPRLVCFRFDFGTLSRSSLFVIRLTLSSVLLVNRHKIASPLNADHDLVL